MEHAKIMVMLSTMLMELMTAATVPSQPFSMVIIGAQLATGANSITTSVRATSVSYTHLDVYKRQRERCYAGAHARLQQLRKHARGYPMVPVAFAHAGVHLRAMAHARPPWPRKPAPVSYTHLAVYKRQRLDYRLRVPPALMV